MPGEVYRVEKPAFTSRRTCPKVQVRVTSLGFVLVYAGGAPPFLSTQVLVLATPRARQELPLL